MTITTRTLRDGPTTSDRIVLQGGTAPSAALSTRKDGFDFQGADRLHLYVDLGTATGATITTWVWSDISQAWYAHTQTVFSSTVKRATIELRAENAVGFVLDAIAGAGTIKLWAGYSYDGADGV